MLDIPYLLRATARLIERRRTSSPPPSWSSSEDEARDAWALNGCGCPPPPGEPPNYPFNEGEWHDDEPLDDDLGCCCDGGYDPADGPDWRRWYDSHRHDVEHVPTPIVDACIEEIREATVLHAVAVLEIARKWGLGLER